jgi:hypothetical protein
MNPYLERDVAWHDFHERFLIFGAGIIGAQVRPDFVVKIDEHIYVREIDDESRRLIGRADLAVTPTRTVVGESAGTALKEAPARVRLPEVDIARESYLEIRDRQSQELVTVLELLSPSNKRLGPDREQYLGKRGQILASGVHLVEIDLLRGGEPMPSQDRPACLYSILISRAEQRPDAGFWPVALRERLPAIGIPLRPPDRTATLDLQELLHRVYDEAGYEFYAYNADPVPPLNPDDLAWARQLIAPR